MADHFNLALARRLLDGIANGHDPDEIAALFAPDVLFEIPGDDGVLPWIGRSTGRSAVSSFLRDQRALTEPVSFEVEDILVSDARAAILGRLEVRIKKTGRLTASAFAIVLTIAGGTVTRFQMLEDSFDVAKAARA